MRESDVYENIVLTIFLLSAMGCQFYREDLKAQGAVIPHLLDRLNQFGRAISDGEYQGAIYDVAVLPEAQGR